MVDVVIRQSLSVVAALRSSWSNFAMMIASSGTVVGHLLLLPVAVTNHYHKSLSFVTAGYCCHCQQLLMVAVASGLRLMLFLWLVTVNWCF